MEQKNRNPVGFVMDKIATSFKRKGFRAGLFATITSILVIIAVVVLNLMVSATKVEKDLTAAGKNSLSKETTGFLKELEDDIKIYLLTGNVDAAGDINAYVQMYMDLYERASDKIHFETVDLLMNPKFAEQYTTQTVYHDSMIVVNESSGLGKYVSSEDMLLFETQINTTTFQYENVPVGVDIEGQLNAAIRYVITGKQTKMYAVAGHGEWSLKEEGQNILRKANVEYAKLETMTVASIPEDCDVLFITCPSKDYTDEELAMMKAYADRGGDFLILANSLIGLENYEKLIAYCGVLLDNHVIVEGNASYHNAASQLLLYPKMEPGNRIYDSISTAGYLPMENAFVLSYVQDSGFNYEKIALLTTSADSYAKLVKDNKLNTLTKEPQDLEGPFRIGVYVKNTDTESEAVVLSSDFVFEDGYLKMSNFANAGLLTGSINHMSDTGTVSTVRTISFLDEETITITAAKANAIAIVIIAVIPALLLLIGICIMVRRKSR